MKKIIGYIIGIIICTSAISVLVSSNAYAQTNTAKHRLVAWSWDDATQTPVIPKPATLPGPPESAQTRSTLIDTLIPKLTVLVTGLAAGVAFLFLVIGGVRFATSYGNDQLIESAKKQITYALIGLVLAMFSYTIVTIIINLQVFQS